MPNITDEDGIREVSEQEMTKLRADAAWETFWASLTWLPIADYDCDVVNAMVLRSGDKLWGKYDWALGYWGIVPEWRQADEFEAEPADFLPRWRNAAEPFEGNPLEFEPVEFADPGPTWRLNLMAL